MFKKKNYIIVIFILILHMINQLFFYKTETIIQTAIAEKQVAQEVEEVKQEKPLKDYYEPLDAWLLKNKSPLWGQGITFVEIGRKYKIDPDFLMAITGAETNFGKVVARKSKYNVGNVGAFDRSRGTYHFKDYSEGIEAIAKTLCNSYLKNTKKIGELSRGGLQEIKAQRKSVYAESISNWNRNIKHYLSLIKGKEVTAYYEFRI